MCCMGISLAFKSVLRSEPFKNNHTKAGIGHVSRPLPLPKTPSPTLPPSSSTEAASTVARAPAPPLVLPPPALRRPAPAAAAVPPPPPAPSRPPWCAAIAFVSASSSLRGAVSVNHLRQVEPSWCMPCTSASYHVHLRPTLVIWVLLILFMSSSIIANQNTHRTPT